MKGIYPWKHFCFFANLHIYGVKIHLIYQML